jgi:hypothetical protein
MKCFACNQEHPRTFACYKPPVQPEKPTPFEKLVKEVKKNKLKPATQAGTLEALMDEYIRKRQLAWVNETNCYWVYYDKTDEWIRLSWTKLRHDFPTVFRKSNSNSLLEKDLLERLKAADRWFYRIKHKTVVFE